MAADFNPACPAAAHATNTGLPNIRCMHSMQLAQLCIPRAQLDADYTSLGFHFPAGAAAEKMCTRLAAGGDFDYGCVLGASIMFYEAQRSGKLPAGNRIPWRGNAGLQDKAPNGASIVGGWCVAGLV